MANKHQQISIGVDFIANLDKFTQGINNAKGIMSKLDISEQTRKGIDGLAEKMATEITKIKDVASRGKVDIIDVNKINTSMKHIESAYAQMINKIEDMGGDSTFLKNDAKALKALKTGQDNYTKAIADTERAQKRLNENLEKAQKAQKEGGKESKKKAVSDADYRALEKSKREASAKLRAADEKKAIASKKVEEKIANSGGKYSDRESRGFKNTAAYQEEKKAIEEVKVAELELQKIQKQLGETTTFAKQEEEAKKLATNVDNAEKELKDFLNIQKQTASIDAFEKVKKSLLEMKGINWSDAGIDPSQINNIEQLEQAMTKLGTDSVARLQTELPKLNGAIESSGNAIQEARVETDQMATSTENLDDKMSQINSMKQRITYFFGLQNAAMLARRAFTNVFNTVKELDAVMTETAVVTDFSIGDMWKQLPQYTARANEFGLAIKDVYEADTLFYQQGLKTNEVVALSNETMKMARIAGLDTADATDRMTNALRGFNMELNETNAQNVADVYSQLAAISASDVDELSVAMTKTASIASNAGASFENTAAFIAQIVETTRESAETAGTALKTVIARFTELKKDPSEIGEVDGEVVDANKIETALRSVGVALRDSNGEFRDFDDVILELSSKWDSLDVNTQRYIATIAAGSRQQSRFIALMSNNARLTQLTAAANSAAGASQKQYEKTLESLETKLNRLKNAANEFLTTIGNSDVIKGAVDMLTSLLNILNKATSWGPRYVQMFTKTAAAIGLFAGLKKVAEAGLAKIGATMGLQGAAAGSAYAKGYEGAATKGIAKAFAEIDILTKGKTVKQGATNLFRQAVYGNTVNAAGLKAGAADLMAKRGILSADEMSKQAVAIGKQNGMTDKDAERFAISMGRAARAADELTDEHKYLAWQEKKNNEALQQSTKSELTEVLANEGSTEAEKKEILINEYGVKAEEAETLINETAVITETSESSENIKAALAEKFETDENFKAAYSEALETKANQSAAAQNAINDLPGRGKTSGGLKNGFKNFGTKAGNFMKGAGGYVVGAAVAIAATAAIAYGVTAAIDASVETAEERLENLANRAELQAEATEQAVSRLSESTALVSDLETMKEEISELTVGTAEWTAKIFELNSQMNKVISQYGQLADEKYMITSANGVMSLTEEGQEEYLRLVQQDALEAQARNLSLQRRQTAAQREMAINSAMDTDAVSAAEESAASTATWIGGGVGVSGGITAGVALAKTGAIAGTFAGPIGTAIGGIAGGIIGVTVGAIVGETIKSEYNIREKTLEDTVAKASEEGFVAEGKTAEEIDQFLSGIDATDSELASLREYLKESAKEFDKLTANVRELNLQEEANLKQEASVQAQRLGLKRGEKERFEDLYFADAKENSEEFDKRVQEEIEAMADKYEVGFGAIFTDWNDTGEFEFDDKYIGIYEDFAKEMGWTFDVNNEENPFIDLEGNVVDMSKWTDAQINTIVAEAKIRKELNKELQEEQKIVEDKIRKDPNSIYNLLGSRMGVGKQEWLYALTKEQIEAFNTQLNQVSIQGGDESAYSDALMSIANAAVASGMEMADVMDILAKQSVETKSDFWVLKDTLEQAAEAQEILGFEIEDTLIEAAIDAADAIGNIDLKKLSEGAETIKELVDKIATSTDKVVTEEELKRLRGLGLRNSQYQIRDDGSAVITDPNWQFGLMRSLEKQSIEDIEDKYKDYYKLYDINKNIASNSLAAKQVTYNEYKKSNPNIFSSGYVLNKKYISDIKEQEKQYLPEDGLGAKNRYSEMLLSPRGKQMLFEALGGIGNYTDWRPTWGNTGDAGSIVQQAVSNATTRRDKEEAINNSSSNFILAGGQREYKGQTELTNSEVLSMVVNEFEQEKEEIAKNKVVGVKIESASIDQIAQNIDDYLTTPEGIEKINEIITDKFKYTGKINDTKATFLQLYKTYSDEALEEAIKAAKNDTEFQSLLEGSWLGQEALNYSIERDDDIEKIYSDKAIDSIDTMVYSIEGATAQMQIYASQVSASTNTIKAFTIENYKSAKSVDALISDLDEFTDDLSNPGTFEYAKAVEEISQSIVNMGWAKNLAQAKNFFSTYENEFIKIREGGEGAQQAFNKISKYAAQAKAKAEGLDQKWVDLINKRDIFEIKLGEAKDLSKEGFIKDLLSTDSEENLQKLTKLAEFLQTAGFTFTFNTETNDALLTRISADGTGENNDDDTTWINPYDKYHNLLQDINKELRERDRLEREINYLTSVRPDGTSKADAVELQSKVQEQIDSVNMSIALNESLLMGRKEQLDDYNTFGQEKGWSQYAKWDSETNTVRINWDGLNAVMESGQWTEAQGQEFEEWVSKLQSNSDEMAELQETIAEDKELLEELLSFGRSEYMELEKKVYDAIIQREKELIDGLQSASEIIENSNSEILSGLQKSINKLRQDRQNQDTEKDITEKEQRLVYLSSSTTSDPLEIMKLEEEIADARQSYTDQLIDQKISELEDQNEQARVQREKQIAIAQAQLDYNEQNGIYWEETATVLKNGIDQNGKIITGSSLNLLLKSSEGWSAMSQEMKKQFWGENTTLTAAAKVYMNGMMGNGVESRPMNAKEAEGAINDAVSKFTNSQSTLTYERIVSAIKEGIGTKGNGSEEKIDSVFQSKYIEALMNNKTGTYNGKNLTWDEYVKYFNGNKEEAKQNLMTAMELAGYSANDIFNSIKLNGNKDIMGSDVRKDIRDRAYFSSGYKSEDELEKEKAEQAQAEKDKKEYPFNYATEHNALINKKVQVTGENQKWRMDNWNTKQNTVDAKYSNAGKFDYKVGDEITIDQALMDPKGNIWIRPLGSKQWMSWEGVASTSKSANESVIESFKKEYNSWTQFKTGGLADFTGPAWLDGTKSAPEIVLNAQDTKNFLQLRDILSDLFKGGNFERSGSSGDNYYDIDINVDEISNDYDVDQLAARIKQQIVSDSMYRNVNAINFIR